MNPASDRQKTNRQRQLRVWTGVRRDAVNTAMKITNKHYRVQEISFFCDQDDGQVWKPYLPTFPPTFEYSSAFRRCRLAAPISERMKEYNRSAQKHGNFTVSLDTAQDRNQVEQQKPQKKQDQQDQQL